MSNADMREGLKGLRKYLSDQGFYTSVAVLNGAADHIDALERALVTARAALADVQEHLEQSSIDPGRFTYLAGIQQALAEIARVGVTGAEPCTEHDWSVDVVKDAAGHWQADALKDRLIECRRCGITASEVAP